MRQEKEDIIKKDYWKKYFESISQSQGIIRDSKANEKKYAERNEVKDCFSHDNLHSLDKDKAQALFVTALAVVIGRHTAKEDVLLGLPVFKGNQIFYIPIKCFVHQSKSFNEIFNQINEIYKRIISDYEYISDNFEFIISDNSRLDNMGSDVINFDAEIYFSSIFLTSTKTITEAIPDILNPINSTGFAASGMIFCIKHYNDSAELTLNFDKSLFRTENINYILTHYMCAIKNILDEPDALIAKTSFFAAGEKEKIFNIFNKKIIYPPDNISIISLFEESVRLYPDHDALVYMDKSITYNKMNSYINAMADRLITDGIGKGDVVAIMARRGFELVMAVYSVLKTGAAYLPVDPDYPPKRIEYMLKDTKAKTVLTYQCSLPESCKHMVKAVQLQDADKWDEKENNPQLAAALNDLAYILYTSGTTGEPKGVMVSNAGVVNLREYFMEKLKVTHEDKVLQFANYAFDGSVWEMNMALLNGATLFIASDEERESFHKFTALSNKSRFTKAALPTLFYEGLDDISSETIITAGSESNKEIVLKAIRKSNYINSYGPTECTVAATHWECGQGDEVPDSIPIGKPLNNTNIYIMNNERLCEILVPGEICIVGAGVAKGYLNKPELTKSKFIQNPFGEGIMYLTGDTGRWLPDGNIEYLGRIDKQVKIRGFRVEPGEIEKSLKQHPSISEAVVLVTGDGNDKALIAFYSCRDKNLKNREDIITFLKSFLPGYMIPSFLYEVESIPVNISGKADLLKLMEIHIVNMENNRNYDPPETEIEEELQKLWEEILGVPNIGRNENFIELGGHSLLAIRMTVQICELFGVDISLIEVLTDGLTIRELGEIVENKLIEQLSEEELEELLELIDDN